MIAMFFSRVLVSMLFDVVFVMLFENIRQLISAIRIKLRRSASYSEKLEPCGQKVLTRDASTSCGEPASVLGYLDAAVQVNELMLVRAERTFGLFELGSEDELSQNPARQSYINIVDCPRQFQKKILSSRLRSKTGEPRLHH